MSSAHNSELTALEGNTQQYCPQREQLLSPSAGGEQAPAARWPLTAMQAKELQVFSSPARESTPETRLASAERRGHAVSQAGSSDSLSTPLLTLTATTQPGEDEQHC